MAMKLIIQDGVIPIPENIQKKYDLKSGDEVLLEEVNGGLFIGTEETFAMFLLDQLKRGLDDAGVSYEELVADGAKIREQLFDEEFGD